MKKIPWAIIAAFGIGFFIIAPLIEIGLPKPFGLLMSAILGYAAFYIDLFRWTG